MKHIRALAYPCLISLALVGAPAWAATQTVTNTNDSGSGSLRGALVAAGAGDTIVFAPGVTGSIALASSLTIAQTVAIQGPGAGVLALDGQATVRVIALAGGNVTLSDLTIANGRALSGLGGAVSIATGATLAISGSVFTGNQANNGGAIANASGATLTVDTSTFQTNATTGIGGGGIINFGTATVTASTFVGNTVAINGGAINNQPAANLTIINSTFSGNIGTGGTGGAVSNLGIVAIYDSTFSANHATAGAAVASGNSTVTLDNDIFADNVAASSPAALSPTGLTQAGNNVFFNNTAAGTPDDSSGYGTANFIAAGAEPLTPLANNGGPTETLLPVSGGPASCAGSVALLPPGATQDQRGSPRVTTFGSPCLDAGSVQVGATPVPALPLPLLALFGGLLAIFGFRRVQRVTR